MGADAALHGVVNARFVFTLAHACAIMLALFHKESNVAASLSAGHSADDEAAADRSIVAVLVLAVLCSLVSFVGLFGGFSLFHPRVSFVQVVCQFFGSVFTAWFIVDSWSVGSYWCVPQRT